MNQSTNYNFNLPEGTDLVNLLTQLIPNWSNLDTILKGVQDATFQNATETVSLGVHAITRLTPGAKLLKWVATGNFESGETFTIDGISTPAALPSGEALGDDAYITGAVVIAALNADESAMTVYVTSGTVAVAADSERLGGELPSYYASDSDLTSVSNVANSAASAISLKNLVNTYYDNVVKKLYEVNADGTKGGEISMGANRCYTFLQHTAINDIDISGLNDSDYITFTVYYQAGNSKVSERVAVSTVKTWTNHILSAQTNVGLDITYSSGKLNITCLSSNNIVMASIIFD